MKLEYTHRLISAERKLLVWGSTTSTNLKKIYSQQKHDIRVEYSKDRLSHTRELFNESKVLNIYQVSV